MRSLLFCEDYFGAEQYDDALRNCNKALSINESSTRALMIRGQIYREREEWGEARADFGAVVENSESNTDALQNLAYVNAQLGNTDRATELYREYLNFNPDDTQIRLNVAYNLASAGGLDEAIELLQEGIRRDSTNANLWEYMGDVALRKGTTGSGTNVQGQSAGVEDTAAMRLAVDAYDNVLEIRGDSASPQLIRNTIAAQMQMGNLEEGLNFANRALENRPEDVELLGLKANILARQEDYAEAASIMDSVISLDPEFDRAYVRRGSYRLQAVASADEVLSDFEQAVENGTSGNTIANRMLAIGHNDYLEDGDLATASQLFESGLEFAESGSDAADQLHFFLGYASYQMGEQVDNQNAEEACEPAQRALEYFEQAASNLKQAGDYQASSQDKLIKAAGDYTYRQNQIIKKAC
jgi:tetratricopeptide (TPR) repeat protein